jgi:hypothetical protein
MSSQPVEKPSAEARFRQAFERLKKGEPNVLERGAQVSQNNVAREAGCDPSALKKARFPILIREIQQFIELHDPVNHVAATKVKLQRVLKRSAEERLNDAIRQRDTGQSLLTNANLRIVELTTEVQSLQHQLDQLQPPPIRLGRS